jgi:16S rRNA processing protein RimM
VSATPSSDERGAGAAPQEWDAMVLVGRIARAHGLQGHVVVNPETDFVEERFRVGATLWTRRGTEIAAVVIEAMRVQGGRPVVRVAGVETVEAAGALAGLELRVPETELQALEPGIYYHHQLVGCSVQAGDVVVGEVVRVDGGSAGSLLVVNGSSSEVLIPLAADICVEIDVGARRIRINPPEGLLDLNETKRSRRT